MIKIKINEGRFTNALTAKAQSLNVKLPKPEQQPKSVEQPVQPQEPEQQIKKDQVIQYNNEFYSFTTSAKAKKLSWHKIVDGMYELVKDENLINDLNNFATNKKQVATTASLDLEDQETEEVQRQPQQTSQINFKELWDQVNNKTENPFDFYESIKTFLLRDQTYSQKFSSELYELDQLIRKQFQEIQTGMRELKG